MKKKKNSIRNAFDYVTLVAQTTMMKMSAYIQPSLFKYWIQILLNHAKGIFGRHQATKIGASLSRGNDGCPRRHN